jgi:hypothetical protein
MKKLLHQEGRKKNVIILKERRKIRKDLVITLGTRERRKNVKRRRKGRKIVIKVRR